MFYWHHTNLIPGEEEFNTSGSSLLEGIAAAAAIEVSAPLEGHNI